MMMKCPECGCKFREQEGKEEEYPEESEMEGGEEEYSEESSEDEPLIEGEVKVEKVEVPSDKEDMIKKKLMELGKMLASIK